MDVWSSFMDLVHAIGAVGCALLVGGFAAAAEPGRAVFYAVAALAFAAAYLRRRHVERPAAAPRVIDLTAPAVPARELQER
ncbi:hypothetical protein GTR02_13105 [Kineococcus sp. R8]|uniref:hypothetical protein n=1 Tax=Kineococcus siccus TaxID=2696567 RepID=UPI001412F904|nr:hypothetical protein [Kineococcus siccus]NAZ82759.1 hypothetical protein [Kineococcus siccus]